MAAPWYITREELKASLDFKETARNNAQLDRTIEAASRAVERLTHRRFYPEIATRYFDWPARRNTPPWDLDLGDNELISLTTLTAAGTAIPSTDYFLRRYDDKDEPPYSHIEIDLASSASFSAGDTHQRAIALTGVFGFADDSSPAGALAEALDASETEVQVTNVSEIGVGSLIKVDSERMLVTAKSWIDSTQNTGGALTAAKNNETVAVTTGSAYFVGEVILVNSEKMLIVDISGNNLTVKRAWDGSTLAAHDTAQDIYVERSLTVVRGAVGTTAATHTDATAITRWVPPALVSELALAEAAAMMGNRSAGYSGSSGSGGNAKTRRTDPLEDLRTRVHGAYGRIRIAAV